MIRALRSVLGLEVSSDADEAVHADAAPSDQVLAVVAYNELLVAIDVTQVIWRDSHAGDETAGPIVRVPTLGSWAWSSRKDAKARVAEKYPELDEKACARAAKLIEWQIGKQNLREFRRGPKVDRFDREYERFWRGHNV